MPVFSASSVPSVVGMYVSKFVDPAGQLSNLVVLSGGSGYSTSSPPTVVINGGGGSGAQIEPVIIGGKIAGLKFVHDNNLGDLRGSNYTGIPTFSFVGGPGSGANMTCNLSQNTTILGVPANENSLLQFCYDQGINYIALYNMRSVNWGSNSSTNISSPGKNLLANFIQKARTSGITQVGAITSGNAADVDNIIAYQNSRTSASQRFDWINLEKEYWNGDGTIVEYVNRLTYMKQQATGGTPFTLGVEIYLGWPSYSDMLQILPHTDRLLLHDYSSQLVPDYKYTRTRLRERIGSACTFLNKTLELMPIFSAERAYSPWNADYEFMGLYYTGNTLYSSWYKWALIPGGHIYNGTNLGSYNNETDPNVRNNINPTGLIVFASTFLRNSNPPPLPPFTSFITTNRPTTGLTSGDTIILSANPIGFSYQWFPNGETTRNINVTQNGSYYVKVTNFSGKTSISTALTLSFATGNTCTPTISYVGQTTFYSGNSITLSASSGSTYLWYPSGQTTRNITVTDSGNYSVTVDTGTGCTGNSSFVTVNVLPCQTSIYPNVSSITGATGDVFILSATTTGDSYLWSPSGETTQSITADTENTYTVTVTNGSCVASASIDVYIKSCVANISYTGSTTFNSGQTLTLCSNYADSYLWSPNGETTQCIVVNSPGNYSVQNNYISGCTAYSESVTINVLTGNCQATIDVSGPLYYSSGISINSVTLSASSGSSYLWSPNGETTQNIVVTGTGIYSVQIDDGFGCVATSSIIISANNWNPINGIWTEDNYPAVLNSTLSYNATQTDLPWFEYLINITNISDEKYYSFFKLRSKNGNKTGLRFAVNDTNEFIPITGIKDTTMGWYRIEVKNFGITQILENQPNYFYIQFNNLYCELEQFAISADPDFVPGPYPNYSYV